MPSKSSWIVLSVLLSSFSALSHPLAPIYGLNDVSSVPHEYLVAVRGDDVESLKANMEEIKTQLLSQRAPVRMKGAEISILNTLQFNRFGVVRVKTDSYAVIENHRKNPNVKFIEMNRLVQLIEPIPKIDKLKLDQTSTEEALGAQAAFNGSCARQKSGPTFWGLSRISSVEKPDHRNATYSYSKPNCNDVYVYVLDTGVYVGHRDFQNRARFGYTAPDVRTKERSGDYHGHGTHVAGTIGGTRVGVAKFSNIIDVKVLNKTGTGTILDVAAGINWACADIKNKRAKGVVNMSLGSSQRMATVEEAILDCQASTDLIFVVSAGNSAADACSYSPAGMPSVITVGATDIDDTLASFSNHGSCVAIQAPGVNIDSLCRIDLGFFFMCRASGTSMAAPHVAGVIAQYLSYSSHNHTQSSIEAWLQSVASWGKLRMSRNASASTLNNLLYSPCHAADLHCSSVTLRRVWKLCDIIIFAALVIKNLQ